MKTIGRIFSVAFILVGLSGLGYGLAQKFFRIESIQTIPLEKRLMNAWQEDLKRLEAAKVLPKGFKDLKQVQLFSKSEIIKKIMKEHPLSIPTNEKGQYVLEIFADDIAEGGVVIQYDLVDSKTGNTIWELGRTLPFKLPQPEASPSASIAPSVAPVAKATAAPANPKKN